MKQGWTADSFLAELNRRLGYDLAPAGQESVPDDVYRDHTGVNPQVQPGLSSVGISVLRGRLTSAQLHSLADLAEQNGTGGELRCTVQQNILLINISNDKVASVVQAITDLGPARGSHELLARDRGLHRHRVLQAGDRRDQRLCALAYR